MTKMTAPQMTLRHVEAVKRAQYDAANQLRRGDNKGPYDPLLEVNHDDRTLAEVAAHIAAQIRENDDAG